MLSEATVRVFLDLVRFERDLSNKVKGAADQIGKDFDRDMRKSFSSTGKAAGDDFKTSSRTSMGRAGTSAADDFSKNFRTGINQLAGQVGQKLGTQLRLSVGRAGADAGTDFCDNFGRVLENCGRNAGKVLGDGIRQGMASALNIKEKDVDKALSPPTKAGAQSAGKKAGKEFSLSFGIGSGRFGAPVLAALAVLGSEAATQLGPALPIIAAIPGLLLSTVAAAGVTVVAFKGVGDAFKAIAEGDFSKITESMAKLSPAAAGVVTEFRRIKPVLTDLKASLQDAFFSQLGGELTKLGKAVSGPLKASLLDVSAGMGRLTRSFVTAFSETSGITGMQKVLRGTAGFIDQLAVGIGNMMRGFIAFSANAAPGLKSIGVALNAMLTSLGSFFQRSADSGKALQWVESGLAGIKALAATIGDLVDALVILVNAARPVALILSGVFGLVLDLVSAFGELPGPLQSAALAAILFARSGLPEMIRKTTGANSGLRKSLIEIGQAYKTATSGSNALKTAQANLAAAQNAAAGAATQIVGSQGRIGRAMSATHDALARLGDAMTVQLVRASLVAEGAVTGLGPALQTGVIRASLAAEAALARLTGRATSTGTALKSTGDASAFVATSWRGGLVPAALALDQAVTRAGTSLAYFANVVGDRVIRASQAAGDAITNAVRGGFVPASIDARIAADNLGTAIQTGFIRASLAAQDAAAKFGPAVQTGIVRASLAAESAIGKLVTVVQSGVVGGLDAARGAATSMGAAIQTGVIRTAMTANTVLDRLGSSLQNTVLRPLVVARDAFNNTANGIRTFSSVANSMETNLLHTPTLFERLRTSLGSLGTAAVSTGSALRAGFSGPIDAVKSAMTGLGTVASGVGASLATGLGKAATGILEVFGGPWGLALAAAGVGLSLLTGKQDAARQSAAEYAAAVSSLADTLNKQTGAVTDATLAQIAHEAATKGLISQGRDLGVNAQTLVAAMSGQAKAQNSVNQTLHQGAETVIASNTAYKSSIGFLSKYGVNLSTVTDAALGDVQAHDRLDAAVTKAGFGNAQLTESLRKQVDVAIASVGGHNALAAAVRDEAGKVTDAAKATRDAASAMTPAQRTAKLFSDALGVLGDNAATAESKALALSTALKVLAGGNIDAETAQAKFTDTLSKMHDSIDGAADGVTGLGAEMLTLEGRINPNSEAGAQLIGVYNELNTSLSESSVATLKAGRESGNLAGAMQTVSENTQRARDEFIAHARALGLDETQANNLANAYGLIPNSVVTLLSTAGTADLTIKEVDSVRKTLAILPPNTPVRVESITDEAQRKLNVLGFTVVTLPDGHFEVFANTDPAQGEVDRFIKDNSGKVIAIRVETVNGPNIQAVDSLGRPIGRPANRYGDIIRYDQGGFGRLRPMPANRAEIVSPNTWRVVGDRPAGDESFIPINRSARSRSILRQTAHEMGFELMAQGGLLGRGSTDTGGRVLNISPGAIVVNAPFANPDLVARSVLNEVARAAVG